MRIAHVTLVVALTWSTLALAEEPRCSLRWRGLQRGVEYVLGVARP